MDENTAGNRSDIPVLETRNLAIYAGSRCLLEPLSLCIEGRKPVIVLGQTGSGKSLLASAIMGILPEDFRANRSKGSGGFKDSKGSKDSKSNRENCPEVSRLRSEGQIVLFGQRIDRTEPENEKKRKQHAEQYWGRRLAMLPQEPWFSLSPLVRCGEQIAEVGRLVLNRTRAAAREQMRHDMTKMGLERDCDKYPFELSGGMAQRVAYLAATAAGGASRGNRATDDEGGAELLLADEPTKGLDESRRNQVIDLLLGHLSHGSLLCITHDLKVAEALAAVVDSELLVMRRGQVIERGPARQILEKPQAVYTQALIRAQPQYWPQATDSATDQATDNECKAGQKTVVEVKNLSLERGGKCLFSGLNFRLERGRVMGLSGDSGCGKSSLGDALLGLLAPCEGLICFAMPDGQFAAPGALPAGQVLKLYQDPPRTVPHSVSLKVLLRDLCNLYRLGESGEHRIKLLLRRLELPEALLERYPTQISGGELQRFAILRALLLRPRLLVADEPTSRLDPITAARTLRLIVDVSRETGCALLLISHEHLALEKLCDTVLVLSE
ncbi:ATP-binding cassette domain-containing protein [Candidatus Haliotispira prima]|uniref:ATP-binding cassette domain-containing protein n=1 Tax=Candidatus Haliotispira prima TaxID=3034016 RepID=A0ABY8MH07_9SPIO|nr:ATP-binding cassette domain-containing protein [Candidatus Haliotispira prima]